MAEKTDPLIRFLLNRTHTRGAIIKGHHIHRTARETHGLSDGPAQLLGQTLVASILLLSLNKGGVRQVLQLDGKGGPAARVLAEARLGSVRGYMQWHDQAVSISKQPGELTWLGDTVTCSTVRDLGFGSPYVSTIAAGSPFLADALVHYLAQSVQVRADIVLHGDTGLMIEAMPGCDDENWFESVKCMAGISEATLEASPETILEAFAPLECKVVEKDNYIYRCDCKPEQMAEVLERLPAVELNELADADGKITLSCRYCGKSYKIDQP
ncbi:MAG TPA: Hsp33 family molecular chaperone HslO [Mariprofundaceae bacterium]|nr:Hsp33 family molecular chaperone HslO [Mariprofundaceae bacterium]